MKYTGNTNICYDIITELTDSYGVAIHNIAEQCHIPTLAISRIANGVTSQMQSRYFTQLLRYYFSVQLGYRSDGQR